MWIELHQSVFRHPKTLRLAATVGKSRITTVGHLAALWCWALDAAPEGGPLTEAEIKHGFEWAGPAPKVVDALLASGYLDQRDDGLWLHNWDDYAGKLISRRETNRARMRDARAKHVLSTLGARAPATVPTKPTVPNQPRSDPSDRAVGPPPLDRLLAASKANDQVAAVVDFYGMNGVTLTQQQKGHLASVLSKYGHGAGMVRALGSSLGAVGDPISFVEGGMNGRTKEAGQGDRRGGEKPAAASSKPGPFAQYG